MRPPSMMVMWLPSLMASSRSWLTKTMVFFSCFCSCSSSPCRCSRISGSSAEKGSSISKISASVANARARPTRCCMPPESWCAYLWPQACRPTSSSFSATILARCAAGMPLSSSPRPTFSLTVRQGSSANCWNTMATRVVRKRRRVVASQRVRSTVSPLRSRTSTEPRLAWFSPFKQRNSVDLPEPDKPISTEISPSATARLQSAAPRTAPVASRISWRFLPASSRPSAAAGSLPNTTSTCRNSAMGGALDRGSSMGFGFAEAVKDDGHDHDGQTGFKAVGNIH